MAEVSKQEFDTRYRAWCEADPGREIPPDSSPEWPKFQADLATTLGIYYWRINHKRNGGLFVNLEGLPGTETPGPRFKMDTLTAPDPPDRPNDLHSEPELEFWQAVYVASINAFEQDPASAADAAVKALKERRAK